MSELTIWQQLAAPLEPGSIKKRKQEYTRNGEKKSFEVSYIDARTVIERLNAVVPGDWHFENELISMPCDASNGKWVIKGRLTVNGCVHEDFGMNDNEDAFDPPKSAVSDALKRCAVHFGIGMELYPGHAPKAEQRGPSTNVKPQNAPQKPPQATKGTGAEFAQMEGTIIDDNAAAATAPAGVNQTTGEMRPFAPDALRQWFDSTYRTWANSFDRMEAIRDASGLHKTFSKTGLSNDEASAFVQLMFGDASFAKLNAAEEYTMLAWLKDVKSARREALDFLAANQPAPEKAA